VLLDVWHVGASTFSSQLSVIVWKIRS